MILRLSVRILVSGLSLKPMGGDFFQFELTHHFGGVHVPFIKTSPRIY